MKDIDLKFKELKEYSSEREIEKLNKRIYDLDLDKEFLKSLSQEKIGYIHVKLHNSLSYNKPFADLRLIKKAHNVIVEMLDKHILTDKLDS